jgi:hypothetical protein
MNWLGVHGGQPRSSSTAVLVVITRRALCLSWHDMWFLFSKNTFGNDHNLFSLYSPTSASVRRRRPCQPSGKASLLAASTVARRKFTFSTVRNGVHFQCICIDNRLAARRDSSSLINTRISWPKAKRSFLSTTQTLGKPTPHYYSRPLTRASSLLIRWHEHDATEIQEVCDKVVEQAISNLEEAGYKRSSVKVIGALPRS